MTIWLRTQPSEEPVTLVEAKSHMRVDNSDDDAYITSLITAARSQAETITNRAFVTQEFDLFFDKFPASPMEIPRPPLQSVEAIKYVDTDGIEQTMASADYEVDTFGHLGRVVLANGKSWPSTKTTINAVKIELTAGYGDAAAVPEKIKQAIKMLAAEMYERREESIVSMSTAGVSPVVLASENLLWTYRVNVF